jgi:hypothetical protein
MVCSLDKITQNAEKILTNMKRHASNLNLDLSATAGLTTGDNASTNPEILLNRVDK